jgi:hypothetical protein
MVHGVARRALPHLTTKQISPLIRGHPMAKGWLQRICAPLVHQLDGQRMPFDAHSWPHQHLGAPSPKADAAVIFSASGAGGMQVRCPIVPSSCRALCPLDSFRPALRTMAYALRRTRRHVLNPLRRRRALELLASSGVEGVSEAVMLAHGFTIEQMVELVRRLATATPQGIRAGARSMEVATLRGEEV